LVAWSSLELFGHIWITLVISGSFGQIWITFAYYVITSAPHGVLFAHHVIRLPVMVIILHIIQFCLRMIKLSLYIKIDFYWQFILIAHRGGGSLLGYRLEARPDFWQAYTPRFARRQRDEWQKLFCISFSFVCISVDFIKLWSISDHLSNLWFNLIMCGSLWPSGHHFVHLWITLVLPASLWSCLDYYGQVWITMVKSE